MDSNQYNWPCIIPFSDVIRCCPSRIRLTTPGDSSPSPQAAHNCQCQFDLVSQKFSYLINL